MSRHGQPGGALLPWVQGVLLERAGPAASVVHVLIGALAVLTALGGYNLVRRGAEAKASQRMNASREL